MDLQSVLWQLPEGYEYTFQSRTDAGWVFDFAQQKYGPIASWFGTKDANLRLARDTGPKSVAFRVVRVSRYTVDGKAVPIEILYHREPIK